MFFSTTDRSLWTQDTLPLNDEQMSRPLSFTRKLQDFKYAYLLNQTGENAYQERVSDSKKEENSVL